MAIEYQTRDGKLYAYITKSIRHGKKIDKERQRLGRVLDKEKGIYKSRERGIFTYDPKTNTYGPAPEDVDTPSPSKRKESLILDFGDVYMVSEFLKTTGLIPVIDEIGEIKHVNPDTLWALIFFYTLTRLNTSFCQIWNEGSYTRILYPDADLTNQGINDIFTAISSVKTYQKFFKSYLKWFGSSLDASSSSPITASTNTNAGTSISTKTATSTDINCIHTSTSTDSDKESISETGSKDTDQKNPEQTKDDNATAAPAIQLIYVIQIDTCIPVYMQVIPENDTTDSDINTEIQTVKNKLKRNGIKTSSYTLSEQSFKNQDRLSSSSNEISGEDKQDSDQIRGQLLIAFLANTIQTLLEIELQKANISFVAATLETRNQKCKVFETYTVPQKPTPKQQDIYKALNIKIPAKIWQGLNKQDSD